MSTIVIFLPRSICNSYEQCYLYGFTEENTNLRTIDFYVHGSLSQQTVVPRDKDIIGYVKKKTNASGLSNWIFIDVKNGEPLIKEVVCNNIQIPVEKCRTLIYDEAVFLKSELLISEDFTANKSTDHFKTLTLSLKRTSEHQKLCEKGLVSYSLTKPCVIKMLSFFEALLIITNKLLFVLKFSTLGLHFYDFFKNTYWALEELCKRKKVTLKTGNYFLGMCIDILSGVLVLHVFTAYIETSYLFDFISFTSEKIVESLKDMVHYLMGSPADLKLNHPLNSILGKFFLYHIDLWWSFLGATRPLLEFGFQVFKYTGHLGLSFQIAFLADLLAVASFHVYCIYVYAARLYNLQVTGLASLSRLFIGRKRNPLPGRIDSCPYTTEQLFVGTIAFTVLLFLLPTTMVYYVVFTSIRLILVGLGGILTQARFLLQSLPVYTTWLWCFNPAITTSSVHLTPKVSTKNQLLLYVTPVSSSWWQTVKMCIPDPITKPKPVQWGDLVINLTTGKLIYPV